MSAISYDGRRFSPVAEEPHAVPVAHYHQAGDLIWGEFSGGEARRGTLVGTSDDAGEIRFAYCMVLDDGRIVTGLCHSVPEMLPDGRIRLAETWERYGSDASSGVSVLEELPVGASSAP